MSERVALLKRLSAVKLCVEKLEAEIESQKQIILEGMADGADHAEARKLLHSLELDLQTYLAEIDQILDVLDGVALFEDASPPPSVEPESGNSAAN
jgi:hypothetical protein